MCRQVLVVLIAGLTLVYGHAAAEPGGKKKPTENDKLLIKAAKEQYESRLEEYTAGKTTTDFLCPWSVKWLKAELRLCETKAEKVALHKAHLERMKVVEEMAALRFNAGQIPITQYKQTEYYRVEAEIWLEELSEKK